MKLKFLINGQTIRDHVPSVMVSDTVKYFSAEFIFKDEVWKNLTKYAHFRRGEKVYDIQITNDEIPKSTELNLEAGDWTVYLHGDRYENGELVKRVTTNTCSFYVEKSGCLEGESFPSVKVDLTTQLLARMEALEQSDGGSGTISREQIAEAVEEYMENYPIEGGADGVGIRKISIMEVPNGK